MRKLAEQVLTVGGAEGARGGAHARGQHHCAGRAAGRARGYTRAAMYTPERLALREGLRETTPAPGARPTALPRPAPTLLPAHQRIKNFNFLFESVSFSALSEFFSRSSPLFRLPEMIFFVRDARLKAV
ncbi:unnamed protein product, partial [Brenthis ino]